MDNEFNKYSDAEAHRVARLIAGYIRGTLSNKEKDELDEWICASDENMQLFEKLTDEKNLQEATKWMEGLDTEKALKETKEKIKFNETRPKKIWMRVLSYTVAASVILIVSVIIIRSFSKSNNGSGTVAGIKKDIAPGGNKAILILADGKKIALDSSNHGKLTDQGNTIVNNENGELSYSSINVTVPVALFNTVTTPRGGQYKVSLPDGSKVWLNAASSIHYPVAFNDHERDVSITGEVYFEVAKDASRPFKVKVNDVVIEVLGTHFNVNAYEDEPLVRTTLAEGNVKVTMDNGQWAMLKPGEEAQINKDGKIAIVKANLDETLAWQRGQFSFAESPIDNIMRQLARWYDAEIVYESTPGDHFNLTDVPRDVPVSTLLHVLELTNRVHFKIEDKKITVMK